MRQFSLPFSSIEAKNHKIDRGGKERIFDDMNNGFGWARLPKSFMAEDTVFLLLTALIRNFYRTLLHSLTAKKPNSRVNGSIKPL